MESIIYIESSVLLLKLMEDDLIKNQMDVAMLQHRAMREEIMAKMRVSHDLGYYKLITLGSTLGLAFSQEQQSRTAIVILIALMLSLVFDAALYFNGKAIIKAGNYIRMYLEPRLREMANFPTTFHLWEEHIVKDGESNRAWWNFFESVQPLGTIVLQLVILLHLHKLFEPWMLFLGMVGLGVEVCLLYLSMRK